MLAIFIGTMALLINCADTRIGRQHVDLVAELQLNMGILPEDQQTVVDQQIALQLNNLGTPISVQVDIGHGLGVNYDLSMDLATGRFDLAPDRTNLTTYHGDVCRLEAHDYEHRVLEEIPVSRLTNTSDGDADTAGEGDSVHVERNLVATTKSKSTPKTGMRPAHGMRRPQLCP